MCGWCYVGPGVTIGENAAVGNFCEINSGASIGDDTLLNAYCLLNSDTVVGRGCIFGAGVLTADEKRMTARTPNMTEAMSALCDPHSAVGSTLMCTTPCEKRGAAATAWRRPGSCAIWPHPPRGACGPAEGPVVVRFARFQRRRAEPSMPYMGSYAYSTGRVIVRASR